MTDSSRETSTFVIGCFRPRILTLALLERPVLSSFLPREQHYVPTVWLPLRSLPGSDMRSRSCIPSCLMLRFSVNWSLFHSVRGAPSKFLQALQRWRESMTRGLDKDALCAEVPEGSARGFDKDAWCAAVSRPDARSSWSIDLCFLIRDVHRSVRDFLGPRTAFFCSSVIQRRVRVGGVVQPHGRCHSCLLGTPLTSLLHHDRAFRSTPFQTSESPGLPNQICVDEVCFAVPLASFYAPSALETTIAPEGT